MWPEHAAQTDQTEQPDEDDEVISMQQYIQNFSDKESVTFFKKANHTPPFSEWICAWDLIKAAPEFTDYHRTPDKLKSHGKRVKLHFYHTNLEFLEKK